MVIAIFVSLVAISVVGSETPTPAEVVEGFHQSLASGNRDAALAVLDPNVVIYESGWVEASRDEYASHHLGSDMEFSAATRREVSSSVQRIDGDSAWVMTESSTKGEFHERKIDLVGLETMILEKTGEGWRIVHIHWSSRTAEANH